MTKETLKNTKLPEGWAWTTVGEIASKIHYGHTASANANPVGPKFLRITDIQNGSVSWESVPYCSVPPDDEPNYLLRVGDIVFARTGATVGKTFLIRGEIPEAIFASYLIRVILDERLSPRFIYSYFQSSLYWNQIQEEKLGIGQPNVNASKLSRLDVPIPPVSEQRRIADKLEELFSELGSALESLKRVQLQLRRYRQSVLKHAVEGKLTAEWREQHKDKIESAEELLKRILAERRAKWEEQELAKMKASGKVPKDQSWKRKYKEPEPPNTDGLPELPERWVWATVDQLGRHDEQIVLTGPFGSNLGRGDFLNDGVPLLTIGCLRESGISKHKAMFISEAKARELDRYRLVHGDLLFSRMATVGRAGFVTQDLEGTIFNYHLMRLRLLATVCSPHFFLYYVRGASTVTNYVREVNHGATRDGINTPQLLALPVSLPPLAEQRLIVDEVESRLSVLIEIEETVQTSLRRAERLRQALLRAAFAGELVPQDPNDEPATILLDRIRDEREKEANGNGKQRESSKTARTRSTTRKPKHHKR